MQKVTHFSHEIVESHDVDTEKANREMSEKYRVDVICFIIHKGCYIISLH